jgi:cytochrome c oxidase assembly factor CtaG/putative copper export protein
VNIVARVGLPVLLLATGAAGLAVAFAVGGALNYTAGNVDVTVSLSVSTMILYLSASVLIGALTVALWAIPANTDAYRRALDIAALGGVVATLSSASSALLVFMNVSQNPFEASDSFGQQLGFFLTQVGLGQAWLVVVLCAASATVLAFAVTNQTALFFVGLLSLGTLVPLALQGHAAGSADHALATNSLLLHVVFAAVWLGGLIALALVSWRLAPDERLAVFRRYSTLALIAFIIVAGSGAINAWVRLGSWSAVGTPYGTVVVLKVIALGLLGLFGAWQRGFFLAGKRRSFTWFIALELAVMGAAMGLAGGLSRTPTPVSEDVSANPTPAQILTGEVLPPPLDMTTYLTMVRIDPIWLAVCLFGIFFYLAGYVRLRRRGDTWPILRVFFWVVGMLALLWITNGAVNAYEHVLFSQHMLAHMALGMIVPILLVPAAPVTLALRAIAKRTDGSRGAREWILIAVHSWYARLISNPIFATVNFVGSLWLFYYTGILRWAITDHIGHEWMIVHFLLAGYLFVQSLIGIDPGVNRLPYPFRLVQLLIAMTVHAFFGLILMSGTALLVADWYGAMGRTWGPTPLEDQASGGAIAWSLGEIPNAILATVIGIQWSRNDAKVAKRLDRQADRSDDAELDAYNEMLQKISDKSR